MSCELLDKRFKNFAVIAELGHSRLRPYKERRRLQRIAGDEEFQGAGDDFEFDGEAGERFAVDLCVERIFVERLADDAVGLVEMHALGAAEVAHPKGGQVAQIAQATPRGEGHDFELIFEEVCAGGDFEGATVMLSTADNGKRSVEPLIANDNAEMLEIVTEDLASALPPVGQHAEACFQIEVEGIDDHAVGASAANAEEVFFLFGMFERSRQAEGNFFHRASNELLGSAGNIPGHAQFLGEDIRGSAGKKSKRHAVAVLVGCQAVDDFIERAVTAAGDHEPAAFGGGAVRDFGGVSRAGSLRNFRFDAAGGKNMAGRIQRAAAAPAAVA